MDGRVAFVGGINVIDDMHTPGHKPPRYDYAVRVDASGTDELGQRHEVSDPLAAALAHQRALAQQAAAGIVDATAAERQRVETFCAFKPVFGDLDNEPRFVHTVAGHTLALRERGVLATVKAAT